MLLFLKVIRHVGFCVALGCVFLAACAAPDPAISPHPKGPAVPQADAFREDLARPGGIVFSRSSDSFRPDAGAELRYSLHTPDSPVADTLVVLGHGFMRGGRRMSDLADHLASHGLKVVVPDFRHSRPWAGRHRENAADMIALARHLDAERVIYAGFSAGALSALIAAVEDPQAVGFLGLDLVDNGDGQSAAAAARFPLHGLVAPPSRCNAHGNGRAVFAAASRSIVIEVPEASHCDFEFPADGKCRLFCGGLRSSSATRGIQDRILSLATRAILQQANI